MKKYTIKNYKGNIVESLLNFSKKHEGVRIVEAKENDEGNLDIQAEAAEAKLYSFDCSFSNDRNETTLEKLEKGVRAAAKKYKGVSIVKVDYTKTKDKIYQYVDAEVVVKAEDKQELQKFVKDWYFGGNASDEDVAKQISMSETAE